LLWGDPQYVRRFAESAKLYGGTSFEVNEMLGTKMLAQPHTDKPFELLNPEYRYYRWEFERYWHFYQTFGRVAYNPGTPSEVWRREFARRFGDDAGERLMRGLHLASNVIPRIVAASYRYRYFPTTRGWAEKMRMDDLPVYATAEGSDTQQFINFRDEAERILNGTETARRRRAETSRWFARQSQAILDEVARAEAVFEQNRNTEFVSTVTDLKILAYLALYHSRRMPAAVSYNLFLETRDLYVLNDAIAHEAHAIEAWRRLVEAAGDVYTDNLAMGIAHGGLAGHWRDELVLLETGLNELRKQQESFKLTLKKKTTDIAHVPVRRLRPGQPLEIRATVYTDDPPIRALGYWVDPKGSRRQVLLRPDGGGMYAGTISHGINEGALRYWIEVEGASGDRAAYPPAGASRSFEVTVTGDRVPPMATLLPVERVKPGQPLRVAARVTDPAGVKWVRLRYRHLTQFEDYETLEMTYDPKAEAYVAFIPGEFITPDWDMMYFIEAMDNHQNGRMYPDMEIETPYIVVELKR
jgi:hypothetical protein